MSAQAGAATRQGILGGTFNPPHVAHLIVAHVVRETLALDRILLIPSSVHAFKGQAEATPVQRATMAELAVAGDRWLGVDRLEIQRGGISYTVDTLRELREREPATRWFLILGPDNLTELGQWREAGLLAELADIVVMTRGDRERIQEMPFAGRCTFVPVPGLEISSTAVRERVATGRSIRYWVPAAVDAYIREQGLYQARADGVVDGSAEEP